MLSWGVFTRRQRDGGSGRSGGFEKGASRIVALIVLAVLSSGTGCLQVVGPSQRDVDDERMEQAMARRELGVDYLGKGRTAMALRELQFANERNPNDPVTHLWLGEGFRRKRHYEEALEHMLMALEIKPDYHAAKLNIAGFYLQLERYDEAIALSQELIDDALYGQPWTAFSNRGWAEYKLGRINEARESFISALDFRRDFWPARLNLAILEEASGNPRAAVKQFEWILKSDTAANAEVNFRLAQIYFSMGNRELAIQHFDAAVEDNPEGSWAEQALAYLEDLR
jgi:Tfp pilus assembly protein PilF